MTHIVWLRHELRLEDNPALCAAAENGTPVAPVYIHAAEADGLPGAASSWWLHHSLLSLRKAFREKGATLMVRQGPPQVVLCDLAKQLQGTAVFWSRAYEPAGRRQDDAVEEALQREGIGTRIFAGANLLLLPGDLTNNSGHPFKVFTPFWKQASKRRPFSPTPTPDAFASPRLAVDAGAIEGLNLLPRHDWTHGLAETWTPGELGAHERLRLFLDAGIQNYADQRDFPAEEGVSRLSPHLHFGEISPRVIFDALDKRCLETKNAALEHQVAAFKRQLYWREFAVYLLFHYPTLMTQPMRPEFNHFPWRQDSGQLRAWQQGKTGYPLVDAGMRQLWATGWMHNRVRMLVGSFLVKHLLLPWQTGAAWFRDTLVDADAANNTLGWQWVAGCGPDAAPYFRIFNPTLQSERFDPTGAYIRRWVPELAALETRYLHAPWEAPEKALAKAGIVTEKTYPRPLVDHRFARQRALDAFDLVKRGKQTKK